MKALPGQGLDARLKAELTGLLTEELQLCERLLECIRKEQDCLHHYDHDGFATHTAGKNQIVAALRELDTRRRTLFRQLQGADLRASNYTLEQWQESWLGDPALANTAHRLRQVASACSLENQSLGRLINLQTRFFDFLLRQLLPQRTDSLTYMRSGEKQATGSLRKLVSV